MRSINKSDLLKEFAKLPYNEVDATRPKLHKELVTSAEKATKKYPQWNRQRNY